MLPEAGVRLASCAIADSRLTGAMWQRWSERMNLRDYTDQMPAYWKAQAA